MKGEETSTMRAELKKMELTNFKCYRSKVIEFHNGLNIVKAKNGRGKTTLVDAYNWVFYDKLADGSTANSIRPHGCELDVIVRLTFDVDGREVILTKMQKMKFVKDRTTGLHVFKGNENSFEVNEIPKKAKEFEQYITDVFGAKETLISCTNAQDFFNKDTKKRRAILTKNCEEVSNDDVIATDVRFKAFENDLKDGTIEELIVRSRNKIKGFEKDRATIPVQIETLESQKSNDDVAEMELQKNALTEELADIEKRETDLSAQYEYFNELSAKAMKIKFDMGDIKRNTEEEFRRYKDEIQTRISETNSQISNAKSELKTLELNVINDRNTALIYENNIKSLKTDWAENSGLEFDENSLVCPYCGQEYTEEKKMALRGEFESHKAETLKGIEDAGFRYRKQLDDINIEINDGEQNVEFKKGYIAGLEDKLSELQKSLGNVFSKVQLPSEYHELETELAKTEEDMRKASDISAQREQFVVRKSEIRRELEVVNFALGKAQNNVQIDEQIADLEKSLKEVTQKIADEQKILNVLEDFNRAKMQMLEDKVNKQFKKVKWQLFEQQINGSYADCCKAIVNSSDYEKGLNDSDCLLANIDILETFQRMNDMSMTLWLDRAESINADRIPTTNAQLICLCVSEDEEMVVW